MVERAASGLALRIDPEDDGTELHLDDGLVPISPLRSGGQADEVARLHLGEYALERDCRQMVTFVDDDVSVPGDEIIDLPLSDEALDHRHIEPAVRFTFAPAHLTHVLLIDSEEHRELRDPLIEKGLAVDEDQRAPSALRDQVGAENGLPDAGRADEHANVMRQQRVDRLLLYGGEVAVEGEFQAARHRVADRRPPASRRFG